MNLFSRVQGLRWDYIHSSIISIRTLLEEGVQKFLGHPAKY
jgi:hypothetical protein